MAKWEGTDPLKWVAKVKDAPREAINIFAFELFKRIITTSPVDTGRFRGNWECTLNEPSGSTTDVTDKTGQETLGKIKAVIETAKGDNAIFLANNLPYARKIEYGTFTDKPETEKTIGGFSKQAPHGVVGKNLVQADQLFERAVEIAKAKKE
jgi:hypothetical protein